jgi:transposase-like protein
VGLSLNEKGNPEYVKMQVAPNVKGETVASFAEENIEQGSAITGDGYSSYHILAEKGFVYEGKVCDPVNDPEHLKWLHVVISNAKAFIIGTYHGLGKRHLQRYLDEFCYRFNRRKFTLQQFQRTLFACILAPRLSYAELTR